MPISFKGVRVICGPILLPPLLIAASIHPSFRHLDGPIDWHSFTHFTCSSLSLNSSSSYLSHNFSLAPIPTIINVPHNLSHQPIFFFFLFTTMAAKPGNSLPKNLLSSPFLGELLAKRSVYVKVRPAPQSLTQRRAILRVLRQHGRIEVFKSLGVRSPLSSTLFTNHLFLYFMHQ